MPIKSHVIPPRSGAVADTTNSATAPTINAYEDWQEVPQGVINGTNSVFTTSYPPLLPELFLNGVYQRFLSSNPDYTVSGNVITYTTPPNSSAWHEIVYRTLGGMVALATGVTPGVGRARAFNGPAAGGTGSKLLAIVTTSLPPGVVGVVYSASLNAIGGTSPYSWSLVTGSLPSGLSLSGNTVSGTPTAAGSSTFTVKVTDSVAATATKQFTIVITDSGGLLYVSTVTLPDGIIGVAYSSDLTASGGTTPYTWSIVSSSLPAGLSLTGSTISGTPTGPAGITTFTVRVVDANSATAGADLQINIISAPTSLTIITTALPTAIIGVSYTAPLVAAGGTPGYTWALAAGSAPLPGGLSISGSNITGTPAEAGSFSFNIEVTDSVAATAQATLILVVSSGLQITTQSLTNGVIGQPYTDSIVATGGTPTYLFTMPYGLLPAGLTMTVVGDITGTPTGPTGTSQFQVNVVDANGLTASKSLAITITSGSGGGGSGGFTTLLRSDIDGSSTNIPVEQIGDLTILPPPVPFMVSAIKNTAPYIGTVEEYMLVLQSTPAGGIGKWNWSVRRYQTYLGDVGGNPAWAWTTGTLIFTPTAWTPLAVLPYTLPIAQVGQTFTLYLSATGGTSPYYWNIPWIGSLPPGLTATPAAGSNTPTSTAKISGTPTTAGAYLFTLTVADSAIPFATVSIQLFINVY